MSHSNSISRPLTTVIGSYPIPDWLKRAYSDEALSDALAVIMRAQEDAGIDVIGDGELSRWDAQRYRPMGMVERFIWQLDGMQMQATQMQRERFYAQPGNRYRREPAGVIVGPLGAGALDLQREWQLSKRATRHPLKFALTSPYMMAKLVLDEHYGDLAARAMAFAEVLAQQVAGIDAAVIQIDEPNLPGSPADSIIAAQAINQITCAVAGQSAVHLCFGNYGGQRIQRGDYGQLMEFLNALECHHVLIETTRRPREEVAMLREVKPTLRLGVGVIDVKDLQIETSTEVADRIEALLQLLGPERIAYVNPDCGLRMLPREVAEGKLRALVAGRNEVFGI